MVMSQPVEAVPTDPSARWRVREMVVGLLVLSPLIAFGWIAVLLDDPADEEQRLDAAGVLLTLLFEVLIGGLVLLLMRWRWGRIRFADVGLVRPQRWGPLVTAWIGAYVILALYAGLLSVLDAIGLDSDSLGEGNPVPIEDDLDVVFIVLLGVAVVVAAPLCEELFFRGLLFRGMRGFWPLLPSLLVSGFLFGVFHLNPSVLLPFTAIGALFAWATVESGSLWTSIGAHAGFNYVSFIFTLVLAADGDSNWLIGLLVVTLPLLIAFGFGYWASTITHRKGRGRAVGYVLGGALGLFGVLLCALFPAKRR
jgi:membrane protease YdiL (CAAX protease family)